MATLTVKPGDVLLTPGVVYDSIAGLVGGFAALPDGCNLKRDGDMSKPYPIIRFMSSQGYAFKVQHDNCTIDGIRIEGGGVFVEGPGGTNTGFSFTNNETDQRAASGKKCGLEFSAKMVNAKVTGCKFTGNNGSFGIYGDDGFDSVLVANNHFVGTKGGMHLAHDGAFKNVTVEQNYMNGIHAQGFELQGKTGTGIVIQDNWVENHALSGTESENRNAYSYSVPLEGSDGTIIRRNVSVQPTSANSPDKIGVRIIYEIGGKNVRMSDCFSDGGNHVIAGNGANGNGEAKDCRISNFREGPRNSNSNTTTYTNNGPNVQLSATMTARLATSDKPQRFKRYGETPAPLPDPAPLPNPVPEAEARLTAIESRLEEIERAITQTREDVAANSARLSKIAEAAK